MFLPVKDAGSEVIVFTDPLQDGPSDAATVGVRSAFLS